MTPVRLRSLVRLHWRHWEDGIVVYEAASGRTHQIDSLKAFILLKLEEGPSSHAKLADEICAGLKLDQVQIEAVLPAVLSQLDGIGLIETALQ